jgi:hypothetical protein
VSSKPIQNIHLSYVYYWITSGTLLYFLVQNRFLISRVGSPNSEGFLMVGSIGQKDQGRLCLYRNFSWDHDWLEICYAQSMNRCREDDNILASFHKRVNPGNTRGRSKSCFTTKDQRLFPWPSISKIEPVFLLDTFSSRGCL